MIGCRRVLLLLNTSRENNKVRSNRSLDVFSLVDRSDAAAAEEAAAAVVAAVAVGVGVTAEMMNWTWRPSYSPIEIRSFPTKRERVKAMSERSIDRSMITNFFVSLLIALC